MLSVTVLEAQNKRLREEIDELRETIRQMQADAAPPVDLPPGLPHLTVLEEKALLSLLNRRGIVTRELVYDDMYGIDDTVNIKIVDVMVCKLRKKIPASIIEIETIWGRGYQTRLVKEELTEAGHAGVSDNAEARAA